MIVKFISVFATILGLSGTVNAAEIKLFDYKGGGWVELSGPIEYGDAKTMAELLRPKDWKHTAIYLDSPGGSALEGVRLGMLARTMGFTTVVGNRDCASACALAWSGGEMRLMMPSARVGFHTTYILNEENQPLRSEEGNAVVRSYVALLGMSERAFSVMTHAEPEDILWIDESLASFSGLDYHQLDHERDVIPYSQN